MPCSSSGTWVGPPNACTPPVPLRRDKIRAVVSRAALMDAGVAWMFGVLQELLLVKSAHQRCKFWRVRIGSLTTSIPEILTTALAQGLSVCPLGPQRAIWVRRTTAMAYALAGWAASSVTCNHDTNDGGRP